MKDLSFIPECYIDTNLTETILSGIEVNHQKGCGTVAARMKENFKDSFAVGILDKDKQQVDYLNEFAEVSKTEHLILHKHFERHHFIIQIVPAIERFILTAMNDAGLNLADYDIPDDFEKFKKQAKSVNRKTDPNFKRLFKKLIQKESAQVILLKNWLIYLREKKYESKIEELAAFNTID